MRKHRTHQQDMIFLEFMKSNREIARGQFRHKGSISYDAWKKLSVALNACGPPRKTPDEWHKTFKVCKNIIKKKLMKHRKMSLDARGTHIVNPLNAWENEFSDIFHLRTEVDGSVDADIGFIVSDLFPSNDASAFVVTEEKQQDELVQEPLEPVSQQTGPVDDSRIIKEEALEISMALSTPSSSRVVNNAAGGEIRSLNETNNNVFTTVYARNSIGETPTETTNNNTNEPTASSSFALNNNESALNAIAEELRSLNETTKAASKSLSAMGSQICMLLEKGMKESQKQNALLAKLLKKK